VHAVAEVLVQLLQPAEQGMHCALATSANVEAGHCDAGTHALVFATRNVPAAHETAHDELPEGLNVPATHAVHTMAAAAPENVPAGHCLHVNPSAPYEPALQSVQRSTWT
jgi:hypothetical protein